MTLPEHPTIEQLLQIIVELQQRVVTLEAENAALREQVRKLGPGQGPKPPALSDLPHFVKPNKPKKEPKEKRGRRQRDQGYARPLSAPTRIQDHALDECPDCGHALSEGWVHAEREVIDIPPVSVEVVRHRFWRRHCGVCQKNHAPRASDVLAGLVVGRQRIGIRLMSLVAHLVNVCRTPLSTVRQLLASLYGVRLSHGEIVYLLQAVAERGRRDYEALQQSLREQPFVHADETGWREDGVNGYLWSFSTPGLRFFVREQSRGHQVPERVLGPGWPGILVSDFYSGYHYHLGLHQRCWAHLLRDVRSLEEAFGSEASVKRWCQQVHLLYEEATSVCWIDKQARIRAREHLQRRLVRLARPFAGTEAVHSTLAARLLRFEPELFTFVEHPHVPPDNNAAERAIRPAVITRKVCGGTRSRRGSDVRAILMSLFGTWMARGVDPLDACAQMLRNTA